MSNKEKKEIKKLTNIALRLWRQKVKENAGGVCEATGCKVKKHLHCHHIESYSLNKALRFDPRNGVAFCSTHHKFGRKSAHRSFVFMYLFMLNKRLDDLQYLIDNYDKKVVIDREFLINKIKELMGQENKNFSLE
jgi:hypothetical protein